MMKIRQMQGFTLIEVMVALVIFALGFTAVVTMTTGSVGSNAIARAISGSAEKAAEHIELLTALPYEDALLQDDPTATGANLGLGAIRNPMPSVAAVTTGTFDMPNPAARPADYTQMTSPAGVCTITDAVGAPIAGPCTPDANYTIYWNVAEDTPIARTKTIMVIVTSTGQGPQKTVVLQHIIPERT
ncbi:MAG: type IV pilus modification PilV family protein [Desulfobulbia bacterium]